MQRWRNKLLLLGGAALLGVAIPALSQETPEPLLPPGFGDPEAPTPPPAGDPAPPALTPDTPGETTPAPIRSLPPSETTVVETTSDENLPEIEAVEPPPPPIEIPDASRRPVDVVGVLEAGGGGLGMDAFQRANGRFLSSLMRRTDAPLPSRWTSILLRRALLSRAPAPAFVHPVDWVAERAWLLLRMGEADAARMLVQSVDVDRFTPKMFSIAVQTALATSDPMALCPLVGPGRETSDEPVWPLAEAICSALEGEPGKASQLIDQARRRSRAGGIDVSLAEKIVGAGANTRRAVTIQWEDVDRLSSWRYGLATATGVEIPGALINGASPHVRAWQARAPMLPIEQRVDAAQTAASLGVFSSAALVDMYSLIADTTDPAEFAGTVGGKLRAAYVARDPAARVAAMRDLWDDGEGEVQRHARRILTATAASRVQASEAYARDAANLIASMLSAGHDVQAARWAGVVEAMEGEEAERAWGLLAVASPRLAEVDAGRIETYRESDNSAGDHRSKLLLAALAGLGRIDAETGAQMASDMGFELQRQSRWSRMLDRAAETGQAGTVALLAAAGMQTRDWRGVPPNHLYHVVGALRRVGLEYEARMIAAEALYRL